MVGGDSIFPKRQMLSAETPADMSGMRVDQVMSQLFADFSRSRITEWIRSGEALVNGAPCKPKDRLYGGEQLSLSVVHELQTGDEPEAIDLDIVHVDEDIIVINKPAGLVVHPAAGNRTGTLMNALLHYFPENRLLPRAGIVHRLDKDTTGLMVVARSERAHKSLVDQLQTREMGREYQAVVSGVMTGGGCVDEPIGRHPVHRTKMAVRFDGKPAVTHYRIAERFAANTLLDVKLETGRTHQIRVHMAYIHHPLVGDKTYAGRAKVPAGVSDQVKDALRMFPRQALHARKLTLIHPVTDEEMSWEVPMPIDMEALCAILRNTVPSPF
jgi:23S rRNA pseudouridine1911/1915/1917 synthase